MCVYIYIYIYIVSVHMCGVCVVSTRSLPYPLARQGVISSGVSRGTNRTDALKL